MKATLLNFGLFQLGWFGCVLSSAAGMPWLGVLLASLIIGWHVWTAPDRRAEIKLIALAVLIGGVWESVLVSRGWLSYDSGMLLPYLAPYWIVVMWALFATTFNVSLRWLKGRWIIAALFGAIGGPLAYLAGQQLGAVILSNMHMVLTALLIGWAILTPLLVRLSQRFDGFARVEVQQ